MRVSTFYYSVSVPILLEYRDTVKGMNVNYSLSVEYESAVKCYLSGPTYTRIRPDTCCFYSSAALRSTMTEEAF